MLPRADIGISISPVGRAEALTSLEGTGDPRQEAFQRSLAGLVGKSMQADVLSRLTDGSFIVKVAGASARMQLPAGAQVGSQVPLTLVALTPRPTFQIDSGPGAQGSIAYSEAGPAMLPGPPGSAARATPLVYLEGSAAPGAKSAAAPGQGAPLAGGAVQQGPVPGQALLPGTPALLPPVQLPPAGAPALATLAQAPDAEPALLAPAKDGDSVRTATPATSHAALLLGKAPLTPASQLPPIDPKSTPSSLSEAARVITSVLTAAMKADNPPTAIIARTPLASAPTLAPEQMAAALKDAVGKSGLFYESHVAEWSAGKRPLAELIHEPQMQRALAAPPAEAGQRAPLPTDPAAAQFINLQLTTHEQGRVAWQGQPWPGQQMQWEIQRDAPDSGGHDGGEAPEPAWRSALRLHFPQLGDISASVVMVGTQVHIQIQAGSSSAGALLRERAAELSGAMEAAGTPLSSLNIRAGKAGPDG